MANIKGGIKRNRQSQKRRIKNRAVKGRLATLRKQFDDAAATGDKKKAEELYRAYCSALDKATKRRTVKSNAASRKKSRAAKRLAGASATVAEKK